MPICFFPFFSLDREAKTRRSLVPGSPVTQILQDLAPILWNSFGSVVALIQAVLKGAMSFFGISKTGGRIRGMLV